MKKTTIILLSVCIMATFAIAANVNVGLDSNNGASSLVIRNSNSTSEASIDSLGRLQANGGVMGNINNIDSIGGYFTSTGPSGYGLYARNDENVGIYGRGYYGGSFESSDSGGIGLYSSARYSGGFGTWSTGYSTGGYFAALSTGGTNYGIYGRTNSPGGFAFYGDGGNDYFSGNVGLGTTAPNRKLYIATVEAGIAYGLKLDNYSSSVYHGINESVGILFSVDGVGYNNMDAIDTARGKGAIIYKQTSGWNRGSFYFLQNASADSTVPTESDVVMSIRNNGNVGIGTTYPNETLTVANDGSKTAFEAWHDTANNVSLATGSIGVLAYGSAYGGTFTCNFLNGFGVYAYAPQGVGLYGSGVIGVRGLVSSGCGVSGEATSGIGLFGRATTGIALNTYGTVKFQNLPTTSSGTTLIVDGSGYLYKQSSSLRYKENIIDLDVDKQKVLSLRPVKFTSKTDKKRDIGLIAEEVEKQIKDLVIYNEKGQPESVKYDRVAIYLLGVIKGQQKDIDELKREVKELKASEKK